MKPTYEELIVTLEDMALQYLSDIDGIKLSHDFMIAGENCLNILERLGKVKSIDKVTYVFINDKY